MIGLALIIVSVLVLGVWLFVELKRFKHKIWAFFLIALILFGYISFSVTLKNQDIDYKSFSGLMKATKIYFLWLGSLFGNVKTMTSHAISLDWTPNETESK